MGPFEPTTKLLEGLEKDEEKSKPAEPGRKKKCRRPQKVFDELMFADPSVTLKNFPKQPPVNSSNQRSSHSPPRVGGVGESNAHISFAMAQQNSGDDALELPPPDAASISAKAVGLRGSTTVRCHKQPTVQKKKKQKRAAAEAIDMVAFLARMEKLHGL